MIYDPVLFAVQSALGTAEQMDAQLDIFAECNVAHHLLFDEKGSLLTVVYYYF
jgi:hypothetical protein